MNDEVRTLTRRGIALAQQGQLADAAVCFEEVLRLQPDFGHGYNNLANVFLFQGRYDQAITTYRQALELLPDDPSIYSHLSYAHSKQGRGQDAETYARHALSLRPQFPEALNHLGIALGLQEKFAEAEASYRTALHLKPDFAKALSNLAQLCFLERRFDEGRALAEDAISLDPQQAEAHATLAAVFVRQRNWQAALKSCGQALELNALLPEAHYNLATIYLETGRLIEAGAVCQEFLRHRPDYVEMEIILGTLALKENRLDDALGHYGKLLERKPSEALVHFNRAVTWLLKGNLEDGWPEYEWRWRWHDFVVRPFTMPLWTGAPVAGKTVLLHAEQGLGDTLQFIRYAPLVKERGGTVIVACQNILLKLLSRCAGIDQLVGQEHFTGSADEHAPLLSLPSILKTTLAGIPVRVPYIFADPALVDWWRSYLAELPGFKIGIAWQGSTQHPDDASRSMPLAEFAPLAQVSGVQLLSLQKGQGQEQVASAPFKVVDLTSRLDENAGAFMDTAAVMMNLDLVITSDTAIAHLAGALGVRVWVALQFNPDFRWLLDRSDSPWYPTMRLFRQSRRGHWSDVFEEMARELAGIIALVPRTKEPRTE